MDDDSISMGEYEEGLMDPPAPLPRTDTERLDWLAFDMNDSPLFDALDELDVHTEAAKLWPSDHEPTDEEERECYRRAFRIVIDAAMDTQPGGGDSV